LNPKKFTLFVFGGSQGARAINEIVLSSLDKLLQRDKLQILWSAGPRWVDPILQSTKKYGERIHVLPYIDNMGMAYAISDLIICRSGATTIAEITRLGLPAFFIPFPAAAGGHQAENAQDLFHNGAAEMILEKDLNIENFISKIFELIDHRDRVASIAKRAKTFGRPDAAKVIAEDILSKIPSHYYQEERAHS